LLLLIINKMYDGQLSFRHASIAHWIHRKCI